jgi:hypothetical protein
MAANTATDHRRGRPRWAFWLIAACVSVGLGACASSTPTIANSPLPTPIATSVSSVPAPHSAVELTVGAPYIFIDPSGDEMQVTLLGLIDPARGESGQAASGNRFVAAKLQILGYSATFSVDPNRDAALLLASRDTANAQPNAAINDCVNFHSGTFAVNAGDEITACLVFQVSTDLRVRTVEWGLA